MLGPDEESQSESSATKPVILVLPFQSPTDPNAIEKAVRNEPDAGVLSTVVPTGATFAFHTIGDDTGETVSRIGQETEATANASLTRAAQCGAFWKSLGVEALIYTCSYGGLTLASGLVIRFTRANPLLMLLLAGGTGVVANDNFRILVTSLLKPPGEDIPEAKRAQYLDINKYALLPLSLIASGTISGTTLSIIGDTNLGTQQIVSAISTQAAGPMMCLLGTGLRKCYGGSIVLDPGHEDVSASFRKFYSLRPNPDDEERPYLFGTARNLFTRIFAVSATVASCWYSGAFLLESYCGPDGREALNNITNTTGNFTGADLREHCIGGSATFLFRDWGISLAYGIGLMVVQPAMNFVCNRIFDYFYNPDTSSDDSGVEIVEVSGEDPENPNPENLGKDSV